MDDGVSKSEVRDMINTLDSQYSQRLEDISKNLKEVSNCLIDIKIELGVMKNEQKHNNETTDVIFSNISDIDRGIKEMRENYYNCPARNYVEGMSVKDKIMQHPVLSIGTITGVVSIISLALKIAGVW